MKNHRKLLLMSVLIVSMLFASTPQVNSQTRSTIKIGALGPLAITPGEDMKKAAQLAVDEINAGAGIDVGGTAYDFELVVETTSGDTGLPDAPTAAANLQKLIAVDQVVAVLGGFRTEVVLGAVQPTINSTGTPFLGVGSTSPIITEFYYRVGPPNGTTLARNLISFYLTYLGPVYGAVNIAIARENAAWSAAVAGAVKVTLASFNFTVDDTTIAPIPQSASGSDIAAALNPLTASDVNVTAILTLFSAPVGKVFAEQWTATGLNKKMLLAGINVEGQKSTYFTDTGGAAAGEIIIENAPPGVNPTDKSQAFRDAYSAKYNEEPTYTSFASYDAVYILKDAIERADAFTSAAIQAVLPDTDYLGVSARLKFTTESSAGQVASPAVPADFKKYNNTMVHDLFTPSTVGVSGFPYSQLYFAQWRGNGTKAAVWAGAPTGYAPIVKPPYEVTTISSTNSSDVSSDKGLPGFEFPIATLATISLVLFNIRQRKKRKH